MTYKKARMIGEKTGKQGFIGQVEKKEGMIENPYL